MRRGAMRLVGQDLRVLGMAGAALLANQNARLLLSS
jgi:hypothetical protein